MYAIVNISGKQFRAEKGKSLKVPSQNTEVGKKLSYDQVLLTNDNGEAVSYTHLTLPTTLVV